MQVAHRDDYDTHAVIGGKNVEEFAIAQTAEFFTVLSNTLYSNKPLAVVREVLCNAWDANIAADRKDRPVIVSVDEDKLSIKDAGFGIPHDQIHQIYCVYGNSTKKNDGTQTGGFGLGSKSPFAYSDHFTVINCYGGLKTVHAISRGSALTGGKPDRRVMVSVPTEEEGVEVIIPVKNKQDAFLFRQIAEDIASFGEMNVIMNKEAVITVPISEAENNLFLTTRKPRGVTTKINLRYGNVVYPVHPDEEYIGIYNELIKVIKELPNQVRDRYSDNNLVMILQAAPNTISVTPSRESLSNTETTVKTLRELMTNVVVYMKGSEKLFEEKLLEEHHKALDKLWENGMADRVMFSQNLLRDEFGTKKINDRFGDKTETLHSLTELADYYLRFSIDFSIDLQAKLDRQRLDYQIDHNFRSKTDLIKYRRILDNGNRFDVDEDFNKEINRPLWKAITAHRVVDKTASPSKLDIKLKRTVHKEVSLLRVKNLYVAVHPGRSNGRYTWHEHATYFGLHGSVELKDLTGIIIVTNSRMSYEENWTTLVPELQHTVPREVPRLVYIAPRTKGHAAVAVEFFKKLGYMVVDYAAKVEAFTAKNLDKVDWASKAKAEPRKKAKGLVLLSHNLSKNSNGKPVFTPNAHLNVGAPRSEDYDYVIKPHDMSGRTNGQKMLFPWGTRNQEKFASLFGSKIGLVVNDKQYAAQIAKGKKDGLRYIAEQIAQRVLTSASIKNFVENDNGMLDTIGPTETALIELVNHSSVLAGIFGFPPISNLEDTDYYELYTYLVGHLRYKSVTLSHEVLFPIAEANAIVKTWGKAPFYEKLSKISKQSKGLRLLDLDNMLKTMKKLDKINPDYRMKIFIETSIVNALKI